MSGLDPIMIEFLIDNPEILAQLNVTEQQYDNATDKIQASASKAAAAIQALHDKGGFSSSIAEADTYSKSLQNIGDTGRVAMTGTDELIKALSADLAAGTITAEQYSTEVAEIAANHERWNKTILETTAATEVEIGIMQQLLVTLKELKQENLEIVDPADLAKSNKLIQELEANIVRTSNRGKVGFDEFGNKIKVAAAELEKPVGTLNRLNYALDLYRKQAASSFNPDIITKYNAKIQETELAIARTKNVGKTGFDELGNAVAKSTGFLSQAFGALVKVARVLPGIGFVGIIAWATGPIVDYIVKLDLLGTKLNLYTQRLQQNLIAQRALNEVVIATYTNSRAEIDNLTELYKASQNKTISTEEQTKAAVALQNAYPTTLGNLSTEAILAGKGALAYDELKKSILDLAYAKAIADKIGGNSNRLLADDLKITEENTIQNRTKAILADYVKRYSYLTDSERDLALTAKKDQESSEVRLRALITDRSIVIKQNNDLEDRRDALIKKRGVKVLTGGVNPVSDEAKNAIESSKITIKIDEDAQNAVAGNYKVSLDKRKSALSIALADQLKIIDLNTKEQLLKTTLSNSAIKLINDKANAEKLEANNEYQKKLLALDKTTETKVDPALAILASQKSVLEQLDALKSKYATKDKTRDEQEQDAIVADFKQRSDLIDAQNVKRQNYIKAYNKDHNGAGGSAAAASKGLTYINPKRLIPEQADALAGLSGRQAVGALKLQVDQQKAIYKEYEEYKLKAGTKAADELYGTQIGDYKSYIEYLKSLEPTVDQLTSSDSKIKQQASATQDFLTKEKARADTDALVQNKKHLEQYLGDTQSFSDTLSILINKTNDEVAVLTKASSDRQLELLKQGKTEEANLTKEDYDRRIKSAQDYGAAVIQQQVLQQAEQVESYKHLGDSIENLTLSQARFTLEQAKNSLELNKGKLSAENYAKALDFIKQAEEKLKTNIIVQGLDAIAGAFDNLSSASEGLDTKLSSTFKSISALFGDTSSLVTGITKLSSSIKTFSADKAKAVTESGSNFLGTVSTISNMIPIAGAVISAGIKIVTGVVNFFKAAKKSAIESAAELVAYQARMITAQITYNEYLREQARAQQDINNLTGIELLNRLRLLELQKIEAKADYNTLLKQGAATGQYVTGEHTEKYGGILGIGKKTKVVQDTASIAGMTYDQINALDIQGKLTGPTKDWFTQLKASNTEIADIDKALLDAKKQADQIFTGTTAAAIANVIVQGFKAGKRTAADFADDFKTLMQNAMLSTFENDYLTVAIADFYKQFAAVSEDADGLTEADEAALKVKYAKIIADANTKIDNIEKVTGPLNTTDTSSNSAAGAIKGISADQADLLAGQFGGIRLGQLQSNVIQLDQKLLSQVTVDTAQSQLVEQRAQTLLQTEIRDYVLRTANNTDNLVDIKKSLVNIDKKMGSANDSLAAAGKS